MWSIADAIINEDIDSVRQILRYGDDINQIDEYGFTPLVQAAIADNIQISQFLLEQGADPNQQDVTGGTALQWAVENNNIALATLLLSHRANPNAYNSAGQPVLTMAILRRKREMRKLLIQAGADLPFAQDYINTKLLGHVFELIGTASIVNPKNELVEVDFEGFYLEVTLGLISEALYQFSNHFAARQLRRFSGIAQFIVEVIERASTLIQYRQYRMNPQHYEQEIDALISQDPLIIPVGYEGHAITFIRYGNIWVKCDRREDSRLYDNVMLYQIRHKQNLTKEFIKNLIYVKQDDQFINHTLDEVLGLVPMTEIQVEAQISGNCSWANVEAMIPALFFLVLMQVNKDVQGQAYYKSLALNFFHRFRDWNKERALQFCIKSFHEGDMLRKASKAEILAAILFQRSTSESASDRKYQEMILPILLNPKYEYLLKNYLRVYYYEGLTPEGKRFAEILREHGLKIK
jgi:hypothetical protein